MEVDNTQVDTKNTVRSMECTFCILERSDGSARFRQGNSQVITAIYGPAEVKQSKELMDKATVECLFKPKSGLSTCKERLLEKIIRNIADTALLSQLHPRSSVSIICQVVHNDGSLLCSALNSVCMACVNAGVPMDCMFAAVSCALDKEGNLKLDPTLEEEKEAMASMTAVFESKERKLLSCHTEGSFSPQEFFHCLGACKMASEQVFSFQRQSVERFLSKEKVTKEMEDQDWFG